jgi:Cu+-exporting ATPase
MDTTTHKDPVCGMQIDAANAAGQSEYGGQTIYFCSLSCKQQFDANPTQFKTLEVKS